VQWAADGGGHDSGARSLAAVSSFPRPEAVRLPFDLQRSSLFLTALAAASIAGVTAGVMLRPLAGVGVVLLLGLAFAVALHPRVGLAILAGLVPMTSGLARGLVAPGLRPAELLVGLVGTVLLVSARRRVRWTALDWLALAYALAMFSFGFYDLLRRGRPVTQNELGGLIGALQFLLLYRAIAVTATDGTRRRLALRLLILGSIPVSLLALGQQFNVPGVRSLIVQLTGTDIYAAGAARATGPFPHWHNLGGYLFVLILVMAALLIRRIPGILPRNVLLAIAALDIVALIQTLDFADIGGCIAGVLILGVWLGGFSRALLAMSAAGLIVALLFAPELNARYDQQFTRSPGEARSAFVPQTLQYRYDVWTKNLFPLLKGKWWTGYGPDPPAEINQFPYAESLYIGLLFRGGVLLLVTYAGLAGAAALAAMRSTRHPDNLQQALGAAVATTLLMLLFMHFIEAYFLDDGLPQVLWVLFGLLAFRELPGKLGFFAAARQPAPDPA